MLSVNNVRRSALRQCARDFLPAHRVGVAKPHVSNSFRCSQAAPQFDIMVPEGQNRNSSKLLRETVLGTILAARFELDPVYAEVIAGDTITIRWSFGTHDPKRGPWNFKLDSIKDSSDGLVPIMRFKAGWESWLVPLVRELCRPVGLNYRKITALEFHDDKGE